MKNVETRSPRAASAALSLSALVTLVVGGAGCTLTLDPGRHMGGAPGVDGGPPGIDAGPVDAPGTDGGPDGGRDAAPPDAGPPECSTSADCPTIAQCVGGYCTFCAPAAPTVVDLHADPGLRDDLDLLLAADGAAREIITAWRGTGTRIYLHRTPLAAPAPPAAPVSITDAFLSLAFLSGTTEIFDVALGAASYQESERRIDFAVVGRSGATETFLGAALYTADTTMPITSNTYPDPERRTAPSEFFGRIAIDGFNVVTRSGPPGALRIDAWDLSYLNSQANTASMVPGGADSELWASNAQVFVDEPTNRSVLHEWTYPATTFDSFNTSDRTGEPSVVQVAATSFLVAYPAGTEIHLREVECGGSCMPSSVVRADVRTGSDEIAWARLTTVGGHPVVLSAEHVGAEWQLRLRAFRTDLRLLTAPGGGAALVLDRATAPDLLPVGRLAAGSEMSGTSRLVAFWLRHPASGDRTARVSSMPIACP